MSQLQARPMAKVPARKTFEPSGCARCGTTKSSSFRKCQETGNRLCNSCHCKLYRLKRKAAELERAGHSDNSSESAARLDLSAHRRHKSVPELIMTVGHAHMAFGLAPPSPPRVQASLPELQWRVLEEARQGAVDGQRAVTATLHSAYRAQLATPCCTQRIVLGVLPRMDLTGLPGDPPGMRYPVACLVEAVQPAAAAGSAQWGGDSAANEAAAFQRHEPEAAVLRTTVYGPAGALACWHEGPADPSAGRDRSLLSRAPVWCSGPGGFTLEFPAGHLPAQLELFAAIHHHVLSLGAEALQRPAVLSLAQACMGPAFCLGVMPTVHVAKRQPGLGGSDRAHMSLPLPTPPARQQPAARVHSPQQLQSPQQQAEQRASPQQQLYGGGGLKVEVHAEVRECAPPSPLDRQATGIPHAPPQQHWQCEPMLATAISAPAQLGHALDDLELPEFSLCNSGSIPEEFFEGGCLDFLS